MLSGSWYWSTFPFWVKISPVLTMHSLWPQQVLTASAECSLTLGACARVTVVVLCLSVCLLTATYTSFVSPNCGAITSLMAFQTHDLCGFRRKQFIGQFWHRLLILSFLTSSAQPSAVTLRINYNRILCVSRYIRHRPIIRMRTRVTRAGSRDI